RSEARAHGARPLRVTIPRVPTPSRAPERPPPRVHGVRRGIARLALSSAAALVTAWLLSSCRLPGLSNVAGWNVGSVVFASLGWARIMTMNAVGTRRRAAAEDPGRTLVWVLVLG